MEMQITFDEDIDRRLEKIAQRKQITIESAIQEAVSQYLIEQDTHTGEISITVSPELHRLLAVSAAIANKSLDDYCAELLAR